MKSLSRLLAVITMSAAVLSVGTNAEAACCFGTFCSPTLDEPTCLSNNGIFIPSCDDVAIPCFIQSCCMTDLCEDLLRYDCETGGGVITGDLGDLCDVASCVPGACCTNNVCSLMLQADCEGQGGFIVGATCDNGVCDPPPNDLCANAISVVDCEVVLFENRNALDDGIDTSVACSLNEVRRDLWYSFQATRDGVLLVDLCGSDFDTAVAVYEGLECDPAAIIGCNDDEGVGCDSNSTNSRLHILIQDGQSYLIQVGSSGAQGGLGEMLIKQFAPAGVAADDCVAATAVTELPARGLGNLNDATVDLLPDCSDPGEPGVWYRVIGTGTQMEVDTCNRPGDDFDDFETVLTVYCGTCPDFTCVADNEDDCSTRSRVNWCSVAGAPYYIFLNGSNGETIGDYIIQVVADDVPCDGAVGCPLEEPPTGERAHPGWNHVSTEITLTKNEPAYWSALTGQPKGVAPFTVLDPGSPPGRPDPAGSSDRVLRGYVVAWAVNSSNEEIRWNHLTGDAILINYDDPSAWEYNAWAFQSVGAAGHGEQTGDPGVINLDGSEFAPGYDLLTLDFYASDSDPFANLIILDQPDCGSVDTDLTLHPIALDLRQEDDGPVTTKAKIDVWNENEIKFNGLERCITCWDQTLLSQYAGFGIPNNFLYTTLGTNKGKARIDGIRSDNCDLDFEFDPDIPFGDDPRDIVSADSSLLGLAATHIRFIVFHDDHNVAGGDGADFGPRARAGYNLIGSGTESAQILYDVLDNTPESTGGPARRSAARRRALQLAGSGSSTAEGGAPAGQDRVSGSEKGSVLIFSKVEIRWDADGNLKQDTFLDISNDFGEDVTVQMYFINGDAPLAAIGP